MRSLSPKLTVLFLVLACGVPEGGPGTAGASSPGSTDPAARELRALVEGDDGAPAEATSPASPLWPQIAFLRAESRRQAGALAEARAGYRSLVDWATTDPYGDGLGGTGLAVVALWRWVDLLHARGEPDGPELAALLAASALRDTHFAGRIFRFGFLDALPRLEEELTRKLAVLCWRGGRSGDAQRLFLDYLELGLDGELDAEERAMRDALLATDALSSERIVELQARRLERLRRHEEALPLWQALLGSGDSRRADVARLHVARLKARLFAADRGEIDRLLTPVIEASRDERVIQEALLARAGAWSREGRGQDVGRANRDLELLVERFPAGEWADDALFRLAGHHQRLYQLSGRAGDLERALALFARLRSFAGPNDWLESAHFQPAMALYARGGRDRLARARELLRDLVRARPDGALRRAADFWQARISSEAGDTEAAARAFAAIVAARPYDYYALRARAHLEAGASATGRLWPGPATAAELARDHREHPAYDRLSGDTPYHRRLAAALDSGLYRELLERRRALRARTPGERLQNLPLESLDRASDLVPVALLLALRQDALAAAARPDEARNALEVHAAIGLRAGDLPLATSMAIGSLSGGGHDREPRFLASAYPPAFDGVFRAAARAESVPAELLYALARRESLFDPAAISTFSARGLFQFIPSTFDALDERWRLLERAGVADRDRYLLDPELNARLGARWLADELIFRQNCVLLKELGRECTSANRANPQLALVPSATGLDPLADPRQQRVLLLALMEHSRGYGAVRGWLDRWRAERRDRDLEYMIETAGAAETRVLVRGVLTDAGIAAAIGLFAESEERPD